MPARIGPKNPRQAPYLKEWREAFGWSQTELANRIGTEGTTKATISRYETGARGYPAGFLAAAAEAFGRHESDLYRLPMGPNDLEPEPVADPPSLDSMLRDAPEPIKRQARAIVEALIKAGNLEKTGT